MEKAVIAGRLAHFKDNWSSVSQDQWILDTIGGYKIEFVAQPTQGRQPRAGMLSTSEQILLAEEIVKLLAKGAITEVPQKRSSLGFYSSLFLIPKKTGMRPVINLRTLNTYIPPHHFKMEGLHTLRDLLKEGDWMTKVDLKDAYFMIPIHQQDRQFLRFSTESRDYQFTCLPFGLSCAPWVFTKTLKPVLTLLRELGVRLVAYIDDILVLAETVERAKVHTEALIYLLENLGYIVHPEKNRKATISGNRVPGNGCRLKSKGTALIGSENKETKTGGSHDDQKSADPAHCSGSVTLTGQVRFCVPSNTSRPSVLQSNSEGPSIGTGRERSVLQHPMLPFPSSHRGNGVVEQSADSLEQEESGAEAAEPSDRVGCLPHRMGSILPGDADGRSMVPVREVTPHKLPGAACGYTGGEDIPEIPGEQEGTITAGQSDSSCLYKQPGRDSFRPRHGAGKKLVDVVPTERDPIDGTTPTREGECQSRHGVESDEGLLLNPLVFQQIMRHFPYLEVNLFATRLTHQLPRFYSWRPDPVAEATDAFLQDWSAVRGFANPPWNLIGRVLTKVECQGAELILLAPIWPSQPWYPKLLSLLVAHPLRIEPQLTLIQSEDQPELTPPLAVWHISGNTTQIKHFQRRLQTSYYRHGDRKPPSHMIHSAKGGSAGVLNSNVIQFQDL